MADSNGAPIALVSAAAIAAGPVPPDAQERARWLATVRGLTVDLFRIATEIGPDLEILSRTTPISGVITKVEEQSGRGVITLRPTMGSAADEGTTETLRTPFLNEPAGAALYAQARALKGRNCRFGKWYEEITTGANKGRKVRMCAWIEPLEEAARSDARPADRPQAHKATEPEARPSASLAKIEPVSVNELVALAHQHLGFDESAVLEVARELLGPEAEPKRQDLRRIWRALLARKPNAAA